MHAGSQAAASKTERAAPRGVKTRHSDIDTDIDNNVSSSQTTASVTEFSGVGAPQRGACRREATHSGDSARPTAHTALEIFHVNIRGFLSHAAELVAFIRLRPRPPAIVCLNETFLDKSTKLVELEGYEVSARRDRQDGRKCGGVLVFSRADIARNVTLLEKSGQSERLWLCLHTDQGPYHLCAWYRPPNPGETQTIESWEREWQEHYKDALGSIVIGDLNLHHLGWLRFSSRNSTEGSLMRDKCHQHGFRQLVTEPTRLDYLLDLVITDVDGIKTKVLPCIADHRAILVTLTQKVPVTEVIQRRVWSFNKADWDGLRWRLRSTRWDELSRISPDEGAELLTKTILDAALAFIPQRTLRERKSTHPWLNDEVLSLVKAKHESIGTDIELAARDACSNGIVAAFLKYVQDEKDLLLQLRRASKGWWTKTRRLLQHKGVSSSIPALKDESKHWILDPVGKANVFVATFSKKCKLGGAEVNYYTEIDTTPFKKQSFLKHCTQSDAEAQMKTLREDSGTGPDALPARILKQCAAALAEPVRILVGRIMDTGTWPRLWLEHWIVPLHKKKGVFDPNNYRGVHLTSQLSKVIERLVKSMLLPFVERTLACGPNQFAYTRGRGARDVLALLMMVWLQALAEGMKIAVYCSDVAGAFDRVAVNRMVAKLKAPKIHPKLVAVLSSWLRQRAARVVVGGAHSKEVPITDMVYQGTVLGPTLWNLFFEDAREAINNWLFEEIVYADDLNAYRLFSSSTDTATIETCTRSCQTELHAWGRANQVVFDPAKESRHILSLIDPVGQTFRMLGVLFDGSLVMDEAVDELVTEAGWKLRTLLRTQRYYTDAELILLYKAQLLSFIEYRTPAIYHATRNLLGKVDAIQTRFLRNAGVDEVTALMHFNLAPLSMRRDIAMLGVVHRAAIGEGPPQLQRLLKRASGGFQLLDPYSGRTTPPVVKRSTWGLLPVYNKLGSGAQSIRTVRDFQQYLQERVKTMITKGLVGEDWPSTYSPR